MSEKADERKERLAKALRENLRRRKTALKSEAADTSPKQDPER
ncbi:hypothetical protein ACSMXM_08585 [Pacificimonas sp. ICDLI1SI03]